ncbi:serine carboxypeptidase-like 11 [Wolffia australiana]
MGSSLAIVLVLLCFLSSALGMTIVTRLPGFNGILPFELETGYVAVDERKEVNLFYYFFKSERSPTVDPMIFWMIGGPGCTGLSGLERMGPIKFEIESYEPGKLVTLTYRNFSFSKISNIIFIDSPAGTGFSYSTGNEQNEWLDTKASSHLNVFIRKWLLDHPEYISNHFYVAGDSYGGKMVPLVADEVIKGNEAGQVPFVNIKGYLAGNPVTSDDYFDAGSRVVFSHGMGLISDEQFRSAVDSCGGNYITPRNDKCRNCVDEVENILAELNKEDILEPRCDLGSATLGRLSPGRRSLIDKENTHLSLPNSLHEGCKDYKFLPIKLWAENSAVQEALGVSKDRTGDFNRCRYYLKNTYIRDIPSSIPYHLSVTSRGFRSLVYSGDHDPLVNFRGTQAWIKSFDFPIIDDWRPWLVEGQVAGFTRTYANNLTYATVKGAGHVAASHKLKECMALFERWIAGKQL